MFETQTELDIEDGASTSTGPDVPDESDAPPGSGTIVRGRRSTPVVLGLLLLVVLAGWMIRSTTGSSFDVEQQTAFEEATGIRLLRVVMTAGGGLVELQYQVLDPDKALAVHDDEVPPGLIDEKSGIVVAVPFHEHKTRELHTAVTYHELFMNGDGLLERGSRVTLQLGDARIEHIEVG